MSGVWEVTSDNNNNSVDGFTDVLDYEVDCEPPDLEIDRDNMNQEGLIIICTEQQIHDLLIPAPNFCYLACDFR